MTTASPSECPVCAAVAHGGRIRLTEETALLLEALLIGARRQSVRARGKGLGDLDEAERQLRHIKMALEEIRRTQVEKGWPSLGQLQRPHPA